MIIYIVLFWIIIAYALPDLPQVWQHAFWAGAVSFYIVAFIDLIKRYYRSQKEHDVIIKKAIEYLEKVKKKIDDGDKK